MLISINITNLILLINKCILIMLLDINKLFLIEQKILNILVFSIQSENRHHIYLFFFLQFFKVQSRFLPPHPMSVFNSSVS